MTWPDHLTQPMCESHPDRAAVLTCVRCGSFACAECRSPEQADRCSRCPSALTRLAWEDPAGGSLPRGLLRTVGRLVAHPVASLRDERWPGRTGRAAIFGALLWATVPLRFLLDELAPSRPESGAHPVVLACGLTLIVGAIIAFSVVSMAVVLAWAGHAQWFGSSLRATAYLQVWIVLQFFVGVHTDILDAVTDAPPPALVVAFEGVDAVLTLVLLCGFVLGTYGAARGAGASRVAAYVACAGAVLVPGAISVGSIWTTIDRIVDVVGR